MYAVVRRVAYDAQKRARGAEQVREFDALHAAQPGFRGTMDIDIGGGHTVVVNLWESKAAADAALPVMVPVVQRLIDPLLVEPAELIGTGDVVKNGLRLTEAA